MEPNRHSREGGNLLPEGWQSTSLGKVVDYGKTTKCEFKDVKPNTWILELEDIEKESSKILQKLDASKRPFKSTKNRFSKGDVLYGKLRPYLNKIVIANDDGVCTTEVVPLSGAPFIDNRILFYWMKGEQFLNFVIDVSYGVNMPRLGTKDGIAAPFMLPPLAEQKVIADKLDTLLAQVENTKARLDRIPKILSTFRQSVLSAATRGELTKNWRRINRVDDNWTKGVFSDFAEIKHGFAFPSSSFINNGKAIVLTPGNFNVEGKLDFVNKRVVRASEFETKWLLAPGDLIVVMTDLSQKKLILGVSALVDDKNLYLHNQRIGLVVPKANNLNKSFLRCVINSQHFKKIIDDTSSGTLIQHTSPNKIGAVPVVIPTLEEQNVIVRQVEQLFAYAGKIEQQVQAAQQRVDKLTKSILAKAFRGELTADWRKKHPELISGKNSAEVLLKKIQVERESLKTKKKRTPTKAKEKPVRQNKEVESKSVLGVIAKYEKALPQQLFDELKGVASLQQILSEVSELLKNNKISELYLGDEKYLVLKE